MEISLSRLRNLTTGILHTKMSDIYEDIELIIGEKGIMTHMLPTARTALLPFLHKRKLSNTAWVVDLDINQPHNETTIDIQPLTSDEKIVFWKTYMTEHEKNMSAILSRKD